jgi:hypothetical protein
VAEVAQGWRSVLLWAPLSVSWGPWCADPAVAYVCRTSSRSCTAHLPCRVTRRSAQQYGCCPPSTAFAARPLRAALPSTSMLSHRRYTPPYALLGGCCRQSVPPRTSSCDSCHFELLLRCAHVTDPSATHSWQTVYFSCCVVRDLKEVGGTALVPPLVQATLAFMNVLRCPYTLPRAVSRPVARTYVSTAVRRRLSAVCLGVTESLSRRQVAVSMW